MTAGITSICDSAASLAAAAVSPGMRGRCDSLAIALVHRAARRPASSFGDFSHRQPRPAQRCHRRRRAATRRRAIAWLRLSGRGTLRARFCCRRRCSFCLEATASLRMAALSIALSLIVRRGHEMSRQPSFRLSRGSRRRALRVVTSWAGARLRRESYSCCSTDRDYVLSITAGRRCIRGWGGGGVSQTSYSAGK